MRRVLFSCLVLIFATVSSSADDDLRIPLKIFGENVIEEFDGCRFALWQDDRDPEQDRFAYVFFAPIHDGGELPGWMKIGDNVHEMYRQDTSQADGHFVSPYQLYKSDNGDYWVIVEIIEQQSFGNNIAIGDAKVTIVQRGKLPFVSQTKGVYGCPAHIYEQSDATTDYNLPGDAISLRFEQEYSDLASIPAGILRYIEENYASCDLYNGPAYSIRYSISDAMSLWQVPCALYAANATANYFTVINDNPDYFAPVYANHPDGLAGFSNGDLKELMNPTVAPAKASISAWEDFGNGECGAFWQYQLRAVEGEAVEAFLVEYRRKDNCDGNYVEPEDMPIVYIAN